MSNGRKRAPLLLLAVAALLAGMWGGLRRLGWDFPELRPSLIMVHGPLMVCGFLGTLICLERAVAGGKSWAMMVPLAAGVGGLVAAAAGTLSVAGSPLAAWLALAASVGLLVMFVDFVRKHPVMSMVVMAGAVLLWTVGIVLWMAGRPMNLVTYWWMGFIVLTIMGERYGFSRLMAPPKASARLFGLSTAFVVAGLLVAIFAERQGAMVMAIGLALGAGWVIRYDISLKTIKQKGLPRYVAFCVQTGAAWLVVGGILMVVYKNIPGGPHYDAVVHAVFVGFAFSMIFGHAPLVFPSVLKLPLEYRSFFYVPLVLLHVSLAFRVVSDLSVWTVGRQWGAALNAVAILLFFAANITSAVSSRQTQPSQS